MRNTLDEKERPIPVLDAKITFESDDVVEARQIGLEYLIEFMNYVAFVTGAKIEYKRLIKVFDVTPEKITRRGLIVAHSDAPERPQPAFEQSWMDSAQLLMGIGVEKPIVDALRWFRLGVGSASPEEQFQDFWFAIEIIAEHRKNPRRVNDKCPKCGTALYCETCGEHPTHRPYPKQAIQQVISETKPRPENLFDVAHRARNHLMHGGRLEEIEHELPCSANFLVNTIGDLARRVILYTLTKGIKLDSPLQLGMPNQYVNLKLGASVLIETIIPPGADGLPDLDKLTGIQVSLEDDDLEG